MLEYAPVQGERSVFQIERLDRRRLDQLQAANFHAFEILGENGARTGRIVWHRLEEVVRTGGEWQRERNQYFQPEDALENLENPRNPPLREQPIDWNLVRRIEWIERNNETRPQRPEDMPVERRKYGIQLSDPQR